MKRITIKKMIDMPKKITFEDHVFNRLHRLKDYDRALYQLKEIRKHLSELSSFRRMAVKHQYEYCVRVLVMVTATVTGQIIRDKPLTGSNKGGGEYDIYTYFKPPEVLNIDPVKRLK